MAKCAMPRRPSPTPCTRQIQSFHPSGHALEKTASDSRRARLLACSRRRAPIRRSRQHSPASHKAASRNSHQANRLRIPIYNQMAPQMPRRLLSWQTRCARAACPSECRQRRRIRSPLPPNNFHRPLPFLPITQTRRSRTLTCSKTTFRPASTRSSRPLSLLPDLPRRRTR